MVAAQHQELNALGGRRLAEQHQELAALGRRRLAAQHPQLTALGGRRLAAQHQELTALGGRTLAAQNQQVTALAGKVKATTKIARLSTKLLQYQFGGRNGRADVVSRFPVEDETGVLQERDLERCMGRPLGVEESCACSEREWHEAGG
ncbi:hypothetical protein NDU88_008932 [Pleurodeles waltl]|uniref:Uncharacterized protein n=1 Tax=Pleurodeles waltl TaxID=8319 RepID=A0AAV7N6E1_PLEWA|nr:hypothetical protein NDU88_008932 [Pleurodeles waltl]